MKENNDVIKTRMCDSCGSLFVVVKGEDLCEVCRDSVVSDLLCEWEALSKQAKARVLDVLAPAVARHLEKQAGELEGEAA